VTRNSEWKALMEGHGQDAVQVITSKGGFMFTVPAGVRMRVSLDYNFKYKAFSSPMHLLVGNTADSLVRFECGIIGCSAIFTESIPTLVKRHFQKKDIANAKQHELALKAAESAVGPEARPDPAQETLQVYKPYDAGKLKTIREAENLFFAAGTAPVNIVADPLFQNYILAVSDNHYLPQSRTKICSTGVPAADEALTQFMRDNIVSAGVPVATNWTHDCYSAKRKQGSVNYGCFYLDPVDFTLRHIYAGSAKIIGAHNAANIATSFANDALDRWKPLWDVRATDTSDNFGAEANAGEVELGLLHKACDMHTFELCLSDGESESGSKNHFASIRALASFLHNSPKGEKVYRAASELPKLPPMSVATRYYTTADLVAFCAKQENFDGITKFLQRMEAGTDGAFSYEPSFMDERRDGRTNPKYLSTANRLFLRVIAPQLSFIVDAERRLSETYRLTSPYTALKVLEIIMELKAAHDKIPTGGAARGDSLSSNRQGRAWLKETREAFERRYGSNNERLDTLYGPLLAHPLLFAAFNESMVLPGHDLQKAKAVLSDFLFEHLEEVDAVAPPARIENSQGDDDGDVIRAQQTLIPFMQVKTAQLDELAAPIELRNPKIDRVRAILKEYEKRSVQWRKEVGIEKVASREDFWKVLDDDRNFSTFWARWKREVAHPKNDMHILFRFVFTFAPIAAAQADTERLGSFGRYLGDDRRSNITDEHLAQRMRCRANHPHAVEMSLNRRKISSANLKQWTGHEDDGDDPDQP